MECGTILNLNLITKMMSTMLLSFMLSLVQSPAETAETAATPVAKGRIYIFESDAGGFNTKNFFYDTGSEVIVFDTQFTPEIARNAIRFLRTKTQSPITHLVITHPNPDKFNAIDEYKKAGAKVIASEKTSAALAGVQAYKKYYFVNLAKMFTEETYPKLGTPDITFKETFDLKLGNGETITLRELKKSGVSSNQTVAFVASVNALFVGDLVHHKAHLWLEGGIVNGKPAPNLQNWMDDLRELRSLYPAAAEVYGGRGEVAALSVAVADEIQYLTQADKIVSEYVKALGTRASELTGTDAGAHHTAIEKKLETAFPSYQLGYLVQYGVYGLAQSKQ